MRCVRKCHGFQAEADMERFYYDLHIHSCLSPCADDSMTPASIAGMAKLGELDVCALTDHNSVRNCEAFKNACDFYGVVPVFGMELTTAEDIHVICLFAHLESALSFGDYVDGRKIRYKNDPDIFGRQLVMNEDDEIVDEEENLLINATTVSVDEAFEKVTSMGGACYPAHIDREANGIVSVLGTFPEYTGFHAYELNCEDSVGEYTERFEQIKELRHVTCSDAHYIQNMNDRVNFMELDVKDGNIAEAVISYLRGE